MTSPAPIPDGYKLSVAFPFAATDPAHALSVIFPGSTGATASQGHRKVVRRRHAQRRCHSRAALERRRARTKRGQAEGPRPQQKGRHGRAIVSGPLWRVPTCFVTEVDPQTTDDP